MFHYAGLPGENGGFLRQVARPIRARSAWCTNVGAIRVMLPPIQRDRPTIEKLVVLPPGANGPITCRKPKPNRIFDDGTARGIFHG